VTISEAAEVLGCSYQIAWHYVKIGRIRAVKRGHRWYIRPSALRTKAVLERPSPGRPRSNDRRPVGRRTRDTHE